MVQLSTPVAGQLLKKNDKKWKCFCTPGSNLAVRVNRAIDDRPAHTAGGHLLSVVQGVTNTECLCMQ